MPGLTQKLLLALAVPLFVLLAGSSRVDAGTPPSAVQITEWPTTLRTDLRGTKLKLVLPENALDRPWDDALIAKFQQLTGVQVEIVRPGNELTAVLANYLHSFQSGSPEGDVYAIDIVWPGILQDYAEDLTPAFGKLPDMLSTLVENDTVKGKLIAVPYFTEVSVFYYRRDLLEKYHFTHPPLTWSELEKQARVIQDGERAEGKKQFWGFLWQGAASEALTCNALEWQISQGGGRLLDFEGRLDINRNRMVRALTRARTWVGTISPPEVTSQLEDDSLAIWKKGDAAFMRNWPYAYLESAKAESVVGGRVGVTVLPAGDGPQGHPADILGGFQLMVSRASKNKDAAIELVKFLTSPAIQRVNASTRGYAPTRPALYDDAAILKANPFFGTLRPVLLDGAVARPSTAAGSRYDAISQTYFTAVHQALTGQFSAAEAVAEIEKRVQQEMSK